MKSISRQDRHDYILKKYILSDKSSEARKHYHDIDIIKEHHRFLWDDNEIPDDENSWEVRLARRYYNKLFKEYCIADLTRHKENKVALRWRTKDEVVTGKGQFQCGSRKCEEKDNLRSWEVNFAYQEQGEHKNALVKLRLCPTHSEQLNYTSRKREVKRLKKCNEGQSQKTRKIHEKMAGKIQLTNSITNNVSVEAPVEKCEKDDNVWCRKSDVELEQTSRETDFERYLEDLLL
ncbi:protein FRA10AC1 homolog [Zeugodacus cucurbitae]|uniref:protein FRA10AC1 homolog n=1 Tax=Zeugodacus cucurbitae TaxID=28588 RepID=UPI000596845C|nr:protein FRA10AC1 homolog [Zeugodacus cucurbitae]XP_011193800.1 protein FRA10AC1 homolog [Zeugodacus cucurbitae]XP_011193801.1 protein FRA10AC1 homolog [Zeugodacus cucurbitae]